MAMLTLAGAKVGIKLNAAIASMMINLRMRSPFKAGSWLALEFGAHDDFRIVRTVLSCPYGVALIS